MAAAPTCRGQVNQGSRGETPLRPSRRGRRPWPPLLEYTPPAPAQPSSRRLAWRPELPHTSNDPTSGGLMTAAIPGPRTLWVLLNLLNTAQGDTSLPTSRLLLRHQDFLGCCCAAGHHPPPPQWRELKLRAMLPLLRRLLQEEQLKTLTLPKEVPLSAGITAAAPAPTFLGLLLRGWPPSSTAAMARTPTPGALLPLLR